MAVVVLFGCFRFLDCVGFESAAAEGVARDSWIFRAGSEPTQRVRQAHPEKRPWHQGVLHSVRDEPWILDCLFSLTLHNDREGNLQYLDPNLSAQVLWI